MSEREISLSELQKHNTRADAWIAVKGFVYDVTAFVDKHPGGVKTISQGFGRDATDLFNKAHSYVNPDRTLGAGKRVGRLV